MVDIRADIADIFDKANIGKSGIAANLTYGASPPSRNTGHTDADTTDYNASPPTPDTDHTGPNTTRFHPKIGRNSQGRIPVPVHHGCVK
jgi:hypothetical protein